MHKNPCTTNFIKHSMTLANFYHSLHILTLIFFYP